MAASLGSFFLLAGFLCSIFSFITYGLSIKLNSKLLNKNAVRLCLGSIFFVVSAFVNLEVALFRRDYSLRYVYEHTANSTNKLFTFTASWAGLEGSLLLWTLVLCGYTTYVLISSRSSNEKQVDITTSIAHMVMVFFIGFFLIMIIVSASPFETLSQYVSNGLGANPLLQEHFAMAIHPPLLYIGYVGFCVPFAYVIASLIRKDFSTLSTSRVRRSSMIAWTFLTAGIIIGAWWSYEVLGWGGYWAWDPVENASLLPWLTATAFLHSTIIEHKRKMLRGWNTTVVIATCALTILGTFLTRSGVVNSVHAFTQSNIGAWLLSLFALVVLGGAALMIWRYEDVRSERSIKGASKKEVMFLLNNIVFCIFALVVLLGTTYPLIADAIRGEQLSVGTPYYEKFAMPFGFSVLLLMGIAPMVAFVETKIAINERVRLPALIAAAFLILGVILKQNFVISAAIAMTVFVVSGSILVLIKTYKQSGKRILLDRPRKIGAMIVHMGIAFIGLSIVLSSHTWSREVKLDLGTPKNVGPYELTYVKSKTSSNQDLVVTSAEIKIIRKGNNLGVYAPKVRTYPSRNMSVGTPSVHTSFLRDTYLSLVSTPTKKNVSIKIVQNPLVLYIWLSGALIVFGAIISLLPQKRKAESVKDEKNNI
ncbi:MAG: cytochrome c-type biogenesis CcmF C-terminal domain-containing protein [Acidimicrobiia bacterium]